MLFFKNLLHKTEKDDFVILINPLTLKFKSRLESKFQEYYFDSSIGFFRMAFILGIIYYSTFAILDSHVATKDLSYLLFIRFCIVLPIILLFFILSYTKRFIKWWQLAAFITSLVAGIGIISMIIINPTIGKNTYYAGIILVLIYTYTLVKLRFIWASSAGFIIILLYTLSNIFFLTEQFEFFEINIFFLISANFLGMFASYFLEISERKQFYYQYKLREKDIKIKNINTSLEKRILEKTSKLQKDNYEREKITKKFQDSERRFRFLAENSADLIWLCDTNLNIEYVNPAIKNTFGYNVKEVIGQNLSVFFKNDDFIKLTGLAVSNLKNPTNASQFVYETDFYKEDGSLSPIEICGKLNVDEQNNPLCFQGIIRDISNKKAYEKKIKKNLYEKDLLIKEIYHRTKNNMQIFTSLIRILNRNIDDKKTKSALKDIEDKIYSMSLVHQQLYEEKDLSNISMQNYMNSLLRYMNRAHIQKMKNLEINININDFSLSIDYAIPFSIVFTELYNNILIEFDSPKILHFAPEPVFYKLFHPFEYLTADMMNPC